VAGLWCNFSCEFWFSGTFAKLQKVIISFIMYVPSARMSVRVRMELLGSDWMNFHFWNLKYFKKSVQIIRVWLISDQKKRVLYLKTNIHFLYLAKVFSECGKFHTTVVEEMKAHFTFINFFSEDCAIYELMLKNMVDTARHVTDDDFCVVLNIVCFVLFGVLCVSKCVLYYCYWVATQLKLTNISYRIVHALCMPDT